ncbi:winged helix-turn-helix transcriptional regulator [Candidatus Woesearchaeota archaeon]|nr:winged helix-turn-helix transcriptional regulator [Candidatus Woesearchaeota archaeon]
MKEKKYPTLMRYKYYELFGTPVKQLVMHFFAEHSGKEFALQELETETGIPSSSLSPALKELKEANLLESKKDGKHIYYSLDKEYANKFTQIYKRLEEVHELTLKNKQK